MSDNNINFHKTELVWKKFSSILSQLETNGETLEDIKNYFTEYILIVFYCEVEDKLQDTLKEALKKQSTEKLAEFINKAMGTIFKRIEKKEIEKTISFFGEDRKDEFQSLLEEKQFQQYKNFIENRHKAAHSLGGISISWKEVKDIHKIGEEIIQAVKKSLM